VSEVDVHGTILSSFVDVKSPQHLSPVSDGRILVADQGNHRILLLNSQLQLQRVLDDTDAQVKLWRPTHLCYNELTSEVYVLHYSSNEWLYFLPDVITLFHLTYSTLLHSN